MATTLELPDYREHEPDVAARLARIDARPTVMEVCDLRKDFDDAGGTKSILSGVNFRVRRREFVTVIGPSGCGKSTLIRILAGLEQPTSGQVLLDGDPVTGPGPERGMVFQGYTLFPWLTVTKNVMFGLKQKGHAESQARSEAKLWVDMVGLTPYADAYPHQLSGGMKQRVAIARALANQPRVLLMDEPFGALDAQTRSQMQWYLTQIWTNVDVTILFITHDLDEAILLADRILVLAPNPGRVAEVIDVPLLQPRGVDALVDPRFLAVKQRLEQLIHGDATTGHQDKLPLLRMTVVGDDVL